ncbi:NYN domain-containing protein [Syntrophothermus lipocalidus]|uniref:NYN domain-containing protein n=1 Tax=Syntrophothermus lipocalidus (strain DSM 12680 / TGB-C1) TaxID=643648 RepID=D7CJP1_SYNLT|nr:NYN domain-containing protein [Syntrophothermus lipocalidus]ADI02996.1 protein of unknown function DUF901 [Syntrophothermus lipocalidus DSM 12680]
MRKTVLLVDGYSIINSWPELSRLKSDNLQRAREKLVELMINYAGFTGRQVVIVFDAHQVKGAVGSRETFNGVEVLFSREGETADEVIERLVGDYAAEEEQEVYVATSDWTEQRIVFGKGAYRVSARELYHEVEETLLKLKEWEKPESISDRLLVNRLSEKVRKLLDIRRKR